eukprot:GHVS01010569.1.p1 GENE.GHVS01010569.1~~GHVS01010569.1.p1  ORF type:complete len:218 (+),score=24.60 GHVS01010569.1:185-838(+)
MAAPSTISVHPSCTVRGGLPIPSAALSPSAPSSKGLPVVGFGTWKIPSESCDQLVFTAIQQGYTHIDTALVYGNERQAGNGIKRALEEGVCTREELFISSKLWNTDHRSEHVRAACERSLRDLQISQLDLYLVHLPVALKYTKQFPRGWVNDGEEKAQLDNIPFKVIRQEACACRWLCRKLYCWHMRSFCVSLSAVETVHVCRKLGKQWRLLFVMDW